MSRMAGAPGDGVAKLRPAGFGEAIAVSRALLRVGKELERLQRRKIIGGRVDGLLAELERLHARAAELKAKAGSGQ